MKDQRGFETIYTYDPLDNLIQVSDPAGGVTSYAYDKTGNRTLQTVALGHTTHRTTITEPSPAGGPGLALSMTRIYWASYQDWLNHKLSIDYRITNNGPGTAIETKVTNSTATGGVYLITEVPVLLGDINQGAYAPFTLKYYIPGGVTSFQATVYSTCADSGG